MNININLLPDIKIYEMEEFICFQIERDCKTLLFPFMERLLSPAIYFLFGTSHTCYIGETENAFKRLQQHSQNKEFWTHAYIFVSKEKKLNKAHVKTLEYICYTQAKNYTLLNTNSPTFSSMDDENLTYCEKMFVFITAIFDLTGKDLYKEKATETNYIKTKKRGTLPNAIYPTFFINFKDGIANMEIKDNYYVVLKGSQLAIVNDEFNQDYPKKDLLKMEKLTNKKNYYLLNDDVAFSTPTQAAQFVLSTSSNGWHLWKDENGKSLDKYKAKEL